MHIDVDEILDFIPDAALYINKEAEEVKVNEMAEKLTGYRAFHPVSTLCLLSQDSINELLALSEKNFIGKIDAIIHTSSAFRFPANLKYKKVGEGIVATIHPSISDLGENFNVISEIANDHIVAFLDNDDLIFLSNSLEKILGYGREELLYHEALDLIHPEDKNRILTRKQIASQQNSERYNQIFRARHKNGKYIWLEAKVSRKYSENNQSYKSIVLVKDITKRIQYEQALIEAKQTAEEAVKSKNQFLSEVSHDIRTPMNTIIGISHLLLNKKPRKDQVDLINTIKVSGDNLLSLINDILDFSKIQANKIEFESVDFDLLLLLKSLKIGFKIPAEAKGLDFNLNIDNKLPQHLSGDPYRLNQVLNNLLSNAIKFTTSGKVDLNVKAYKNESGYDVSFEVCDTGIGIDREKIDDIFEPYKQAGKDTTRKYGGTGLGLTIMKKLVELQGGKVEVSSEVGKGSQFKVTMPYAKAQAKRQEAPLEMADLSEVKLLYVEDVISNQLLMKGLCAMWGVKIDVAATGKRAMDLLKENIYDLLLIDLQLPDANGVDLVKQIRNFDHEYYKKIPIMAVTGETTVGLGNKLENSGFNDLVNKPFNPEKLLEKIHLLIGARPGKKMQISDLSEADFATLDQIYSNKNHDYQNLLSLLKIEYEKYFEALEYSIENRDLKGVRSIIHKMTPNLKTLGLKDFIDILDNIKQQMRNKPGKFDENKVIKQLQPVFQNLIAMLEQKITSLSLDNSD